MSGLRNALSPRTCTTHAMTALSVAAVAREHTPVLDQSQMFNARSQFRAYAAVALSALIGTVAHAQASRPTMGTLIVSTTGMPTGAAGDPTVSIISQDGRLSRQVRVPVGQSRRVLLPRGIYVVSADSVVTDSVDVGARVYGPRTSHEAEVGAVPVADTVPMVALTTTLILVVTGLPMQMRTSNQLASGVSAEYAVVSARGRADVHSSVSTTVPGGQEQRIVLLAAGSYELHATADKSEAYGGDLFYCARAKAQSVALVPGMLQRVEVRFDRVASPKGDYGQCP